MLKVRLVFEVGLDVFREPSELLFIELLSSCYAQEQRHARLARRILYYVGCRTARTCIRSQII